MMRTLSSRKMRKKKRTNEWQLRLVILAFGYHSICVENAKYNATCPLGKFHICFAFKYVCVCMCVCVCVRGSRL